MSMPYSDEPFIARTETDRRHFPVGLKTFELLSVFPDATPIVRRQLVEYEAIRETITEEIKRKLRAISRCVKSEDQWFSELLVETFDGERLASIERKISTLKYILRPRDGKPVSNYRRWEERVEQARTVPIQEIVSQDTRLKRSGRCFVSICPLHKENKASFTIYPASNSFHCFGCGKGGDSIQFIRELHGFSFKEAVEFLSNKIL